MLEKYTDLLTPINQFLGYEPPLAWIEKAKQSEHLPLLRIDYMRGELTIWFWTLLNHCTTILSIHRIRKELFHSAKFTDLEV
ncbi:tRNA isopentenyl-2-thiomethyl-A-37 hydroxylase MiaE [Pseudoalteromonas sp. S2755]|uniref:tRNA isopentenyl-2-thiomethyl-A-37 hydroxylase MiaE n=1 Tax=Pseudoalteromonas sp. S2755 TaxID=2066523 RepID=UPI002015E9E1|nr:tRNA isopentenyl-2-thiomethyl-A-37 hydroxylase MiaE [Pseudoalteromonas sp. S2755]